jgi:hypothetical protein
LKDGNGLRGFFQVEVEGAAEVAAMEIGALLRLVIAKMYRKE